ncbi:hypothetical protein CHISP_2354 [Chitinispirillum alkaliphilum]|nr:hypothetical protein CHISP_2354 [Chitinispirillum alkaliphilum]
MKSLVTTFLGLTALILLIGCTSPHESRGNKAYQQAKRAEGPERLNLLKTAYLHFSEAVINNPDNISPQLRNRFIEMSIERVKMFLDEGGADMAAIPILTRNIDQHLTSDVSDELHQNYAMFLVQLADSSITREKFNNALGFLDRALHVASDPQPIKEVRSSVVENVAQENLQFAQSHFETGKSSDDVKAMVRAEYYAQAALYFDSTFQDAQKLLGQIREKNRGNYSAYVSVINNYTDTLLFRTINKYDILLAVPSILNRGNNTVALVNVFNDSYRPLHMRGEDFYLIDVNGKEYQGRSANMDPDFLEQEREAQYRLTFPRPAAAIKRLEYRNDKQVAGKYFR